MNHLENKVAFQLFSLFVFSGKASTLRCRAASCLRMLSWGTKNVMSAQSCGNCSIEYAFERILLIWTPGSDMVTVWIGDIYLPRYFYEVFRKHVWLMDICCRFQGWFWAIASLDLGFECNQVHQQFSKSSQRWGVTVIGTAKTIRPSRFVKKL